MGSNQEVKELVGYLESGDNALATQVKQVIQENLYSSKDTWFLNALFDHYLLRKSEDLLDILTGINESKAYQLFDRMNDALKQGMHLEMCTLFAAVVRRQPSWLYKILGTPFFISFLKYLKVEDDAVVVMSGSLILSSLLPCVPSLIAPYLGEILVTFYKFASFLISRQGAVPDILLLHVQIGVYTLFHRLYAMYPNAFLSFLKENFSGPKQNDVVLNQVIKPMMNFVKFHPGLVVDSVKTETENAKWKMYQPHDIVAECQKLSLDPFETIREATYSIFPQTSILAETPITTVASNVISTSVTTSGTSTDQSGLLKSYNVHDVTHGIPEDFEQSNVSGKPFLSSQSLVPGFSPSELCGLSTPPHSRPQSPVESMEDAAMVPDSLLLGGTKNASGDHVKDSIHCADDPISSHGSNVRSKKTGTEERSHLTFSSRNSSVETSPVLRRVLSGPKQELSDSIAKKHGKLLHMALSAWASPSVDTAEDLDRAYHSMPATPTQILARPKPQGKDDNYVAHTDLQINTGYSFTSSLDPKHVSPLANSEAGRKCLTTSSNIDQESTKSTALTSSVHLRRSDPSAEPTFTPIRPSPCESRDGSPLIGLIQNTPIALINVIQELQRTTWPKIISDTRRGSAEESAVDCLKLKSRSPLEILDEFIECGANVHSMELSKIPLTSQLDTDWTYFGGNTPADESSILKGQLKLLQLQLQYERHKCDLHVLRNRRLVGKVHKGQEVADELSISKSKIRLLESDLNEAKISLKYREEENKRLKEFIKRLETHYSSTIQVLQEDKEKLKYAVEELANKNSGHEKTLKELVEELRTKSLSLVECENEIKAMKASLVTNTDMKNKAENLAKELLTQHDRYEQLRASFKTFSIFSNQSDESELIIETLKTENASLLKSNQSLCVSLDAAKVRIQELEVALGKKELAIREHKNNIESLRHQHSCETKAHESKYNSLLKSSQSIEAYVSHLFAKLEESGRRTHPSSVAAAGYSSSAMDEGRRTRTDQTLSSVTDAHARRNDIQDQTCVTLDFLSSETGRSSVVDSGIVTTDS